MPRLDRIQRGMGIGGTTPVRDERGFTLQELAVTLAVLGVLFAIGVFVFLGLLERWRVTAATNQLVADLRLAHSGAQNGLTDWRVVLAFDRADEDEGPDYYVLRLARPYEPGDPSPTVVERRARTFPADVGSANVRTASGYLVDDPGADYWTAPWSSTPGIVPPTRTMEFNADGSMRFPKGPNGSACVTVDGAPENRVVILSATSRVLTRPDDC